jgi:inorganic pyrophosphatase/exopolyphosphatase
MSLQAVLQKFNAVRIVIGNEACDLDSTVSALVYAYLLHNEMSAETREVMAVIPLLNILKKELPLRTEVTYYLRRNGIPLDHLVFQLVITNHLAILC